MAVQATWLSLTLLPDRFSPPPLPPPATKGEAAADRGLPCVDGKQRKTKIAESGSLQRASYLH